MTDSKDDNGNKKVRYKRKRKNQSSKRRVNQRRKKNRRKCEDKLKKVPKKSFESLVMA